MKPLHFLAAVLVVTAAFPQESTAQSHPPRNVILMIGDGMGVAHVTSGHTKKGQLELEQFRHLGLLLTHAYGPDYITDSAAGATALSTGVTTRNGMIGMGPDSSAVETVLERAHHLGKKTGIISVCSITHATPASFVAHVPSRTMHLEIAEQIATAAKADVLLGSGWSWFLPKGEGGRRTDGRNLLEEMRRSGFTVLLSDSAFRLHSADVPRKTIGLFAEEHVGSAQERKPSLAQMTEFALRSLSADSVGFFLMVEGSQIDWAAHDNRAEQVSEEMADFDDAIGIVMKFAALNPETLVLVTADHETGGFALVGGSSAERNLKGGFVTNDHTAAMVPLFAFGPGAERFTGIRPNRDVGRILHEMMR